MVKCGNCCEEGHTIIYCRGPCGRCGSTEHIKEDKKMKFTCRYDAYGDEHLRKRYNIIKRRHIEDKELEKESGIYVRSSNPPEDVTENIAKVIIRNYGGDKTIVWARMVGLPGDCHSLITNVNEVKCFISNGPSSFGPKKKFNVIHFLDLRKWLDDVIILWSVNLSDDSQEWKGIKMNNDETNEKQCDDGRRPHISWENIKAQIPADKVTKMYEGTFEGIFTVLC